MKRAPPRFLALSPGDLRAGEAIQFLRHAQIALEIGLPGLMLREPLLSDREFLELARALALPARAHGTWFAIHDRAHVAVDVSADALHLGFRSLRPAAARRILPDSMALGISTHDGDEPAVFAMCDYRVHGPVFSTPSKRGLKDPIELAGVERALQLSSVPLLAIGGLQPQHLSNLVQLGARGACARASIFGRADSPAQYAKAARAWVSAAKEVGP